MAGLLDRPGGIEFSQPTDLLGTQPNLSPGQIAELQKLSMIAAAKQKAADIAKRESANLGKGLAVAPFTMAPDLLGMLHRGIIGNVGGVQPESVTSGDPLRELVGLDPGSIMGLLGEMISPIGTAGKALKTGAALATGPLAIAAKSSKVKKAANLLGDAVELAPSPKIKAGDLVDQGTSVRGRRQFNQRLSESRSAMDPQNRGQVDPFLPDDFNGRTYITEDGGAGFAMSKEGYVSHLFKHPDAPFVGTIGAAMTKARAAGAKNLDAFDTFLVNEYIKTGAVETGRVPFNPAVSTDDVIAGLGRERPDFVQMDIGGQIPTQKHSLILGPRVQEELQRFHAARGEPAAVTEAFKGGRVNRLNRLVDEGVAQGGDKWYWLGGMLDKYLLEFGPEEGLKRFDTFMAFNAATSPRSTVSKNIQRASYLYQRWVNGKSVDNLLQPAGSKANPKGLGPAFPRGLGHLANNIHRKNLEKLVRAGGWDPVEQAKIASYLENLKGNFRPVTVDTHNAFVTMGRVNKKGEALGPTDAQFPFLEQRQFALAERKGLDPAEWQSALWVGAGDITGVDDVRNFPDAMNVRIAKTAEVLDIPEQEAFVRFMNGDTMLYSVMGALLGAGVFREAERASQPEDSGA